MAASQIGTDVKVGATLTSPASIGGSYIIESVVDTNKQVDSEDVFDADGALVDRVVYSKLPVVEITAICPSGADPVADFVPGTLISGTTFFITSAPVTKSKSPWRVTINAVDYGLAAVP